MNFISAELSNRFTEDDLFAQVADVAGENYREVARRRTVKFEHDGQLFRQDTLWCRLGRDFQESVSGTFTGPGCGKRMACITAVKGNWR